MTDYTILHRDGTIVSQGSFNALMSRLDQLEKQEVLDIPTCFYALKSAMQNYDDFAWTWQCNLACCALDEGVDHKTSNKIAARFMKLCFEVDVTTFKEYQHIMEQD